MPGQNILRDPVGERVEIICEPKPVLIEFGEMRQVKLLPLRLNNREDLSRDMLSGFDDILPRRLPVEHLVDYVRSRVGTSRTVQGHIRSKIIGNEGAWKSRVAKISGTPNFLISIAADLKADSSYVLRARNPAYRDARCKPETLTRRYRSEHLLAA
jgi:hypothetical protein